MGRIRGGLLKGMIGNLVFTNWKDIEVVRTAPVRSRNSWSGRQIMHRQRFKAISEYCGKYSYTLIPQIWNLAAENGHGRNLFLKANSPAFALDGELTAVDKLHFSAGKLPLPQQITAKRQENDLSKMEVTWTNDENLSPVHTDDELMIVAGYADHFTAPIATGVLRKKGEAVIDLPADPENITGIWLFFRAYKKDGYSWDQYFGI
jgi:hypothetical protein